MWVVGLWCVYIGEYRDNKRITGQKQCSAQRVKLEWWGWHQTLGMDVICDVMVWRINAGVSETQLTTNAVMRCRMVKYGRQANTLIREGRMMDDGWWNRVQQKGWSVGRPKATKWTCSNAGTRMSDVQKASREINCLQGRRGGRARGMLLFESL